jgi:hypothetical protein
MRGSKKDLAKLIKTEGVVMQEAEREDMPVEYDVFHKAFDVTPSLRAYLIDWPTSIILELIAEMQRKWGLD